MSRILIDICHPAHVHFFKNVIGVLNNRGHEILVTSREKEVTVRLLEDLDVDHCMLSSASKGGVVGMLKELISRNFGLYKVARRFKPDVMAAIGGIFVAQVGRLSSIPSVVFYDTENATLQNALTYPFASRVSVPRAYESWLPKRSERYDGYHELAYLHPEFFKPDYVEAVANGLSPSGDTFLIRVVSWNANHDLNEQGWSVQLLRTVVSFLSRLGKVIVSSEGGLPDDLAPYGYAGNPSSMHHVMAFCRLFVGESATMASESVVLGVPAIYAAHTGRGYCNEQEVRYGMLRNINELNETSLVGCIREFLLITPDEILKRHEELLGDTIDVVEYAANLVERMAKQ
ncbi:DUF354 domain-containing protein [Marinobacter sp. M216]|uniref:DUF354 domain-containing protein n=1 Tax=Marinobacter albus TaxID=3030833 RepID=A0ABT7HA56_9GAMM|nr:MULTISPECIES: DUF354 domain-containing protein [unclassified Marinobacter]MBW7470496.1 DUF354 domain-containing protein [Marinobacter sp. F4218]MDK9557236.1 DUF354 domain-containing protein [Marinobacter sp. M216]